MWEAHASPRLLSSRAFFPGSGIQDASQAVPRPAAHSVRAPAGRTLRQDLVSARGAVVHLPGRDSSETWDAELREPGGGA